MSGLLRKHAGKLKTKSTDEFIKEMGDVDSNIKILGEYEGSHKKILCLCERHKVEFYSSPTHLLRRKTGCNICFGEKVAKRLSKSNESFMSELQQINPFVEPLEEYSKSFNRIKVKCKQCNYEWAPQSASLLSGFGCPNCAPYSKGEDLISEFLINNNITYEIHKTFDNLIGVNGGKLSYDFYLPDYNLLIEFQGKQHSTPIKYFGGNEYFEIQKVHDFRKKEYAVSNKYDFLEIWYFDQKNISEILSRELFNNPVTITAV